MLIQKINQYDPIQFMNLKDGLEKVIDMYTVLEFLG